MNLFIRKHRGTPFGRRLLSAFIFTITAIVLGSAPVWAETSETAGDNASQSEGFLSGIMNWINGVTNAVNEMWGMENGSGVAMVVNGIFYLLLVVGFLFVVKMVFNIFTDAVKGENSVDERYQKPSFRKK